MKFRITVFLLTVIFLLSISGCSLRSTIHKLDTAEDQIEETIDSLEAQAETALQTDAVPKLSEEAALSIALAHAGLTADQVTGIQIRYEIDDRIPEYEIVFFYDRQEFDYTIHAETGEILSYERDD